MDMQQLMNAYGPMARGGLSIRGNYTPPDQKFGAAGPAMQMPGAQVPSQSAQQQGQSAGAGNAGMLGKMLASQGGGRGLLNLQGLTGADPNALSGPMAAVPGGAGGLLGANPTGADPGGLAGLSIGGSPTTPMSLTPGGVDPSLIARLMGMFR